MSTLTITRRSRPANWRIAVTAVILLGSILAGSTAFGQGVRVGRTEDVSAGGWARFTSVAWDPVNRAYLFVWGAFGSVNGRFVSGDGVALGPGPFRVNLPTEYANTPAVVYDADHGVFMVVWQDNRVNSQIPVLFGRALSYQPSGEPAFRAGDFQVSEFCNSTSQPAIAYSTGSDEFFALYQGGANDIRGVRFTVDGAALGGAVPITSSTDYESRPSVAYNPSADEFYVVYPRWVDSVNQGDVRGQRVKAGTGALVGGPFDVDPLAPGENGPTAVSYDPNNNRYLVAWYRFISGVGWATLGRLVAPDNLSAPPRFTIANTGTYVSLGLDRNPSTGTFFTAFAHHDILEIYGAEVAAAGWSTGMVRVTDTTDTARFPLPHIGVDYARVAAASDRPEFMVSGVRLNFPVISQRMQSGGSAPSFSKLSPVNGATTQPSSLTLTWEPLAGGTYTYAVCVDTTNNNACDTTWQSAGLATSLGVSGLANGTYYWQVRAADGATTRYANYENWWAFSVGAAPPALFNKLSPGNGMTGLTSPVTLTWSAAAGATGYQVCVDFTRDDSCAGGSGWMSVGLVTSYVLGSQAEGTYAWQVRAVTGAVPPPLADNGAEWTYTIGGTAPSTFGKVSPANGAAGLGSSVTATWNAMAGATEYQGCVDTVNDGNCNTNWQSAGASTSWGLTNLAAGTYYWQVRASVSGSWVLADNGVSWSFTVGGTAPPPVFGKLTPANGTGGLGDAVTLSWTALPDAGYWVCWDTTNNNTCDGSWLPNGGGAARALSGLAAATYYWQARGQNASGTYDADNGTWWSFTVGAQQPPGAFGKVSPANGTSGLGSAVTLTWGASAGATGYQVCYDTTNDNACAGNWLSAGTGTSTAVGGLANGLYYWQVRAQNATGTAEANAGAWWAFRVGPAPPAFTKLTPANGASGLGSSVTLSWSALTDAGYWVCWDTTNNNSCDSAWLPNGGGAARALSGLAAGTYYWQARAQTASGVFDADDGVWWSFAVGGTTPPAAFGKVSPTNGTTGLPSAVTLTWGASAGATSYEVCYDTTSDGACGGSWVSVGTATSSALSSLAAGTYSWQVRAVNSTGTTTADGGTWWAFSVAAAQTPAVFGKASPANGTSGLGSTVPLTWSASAGATGYQVCYDTTNDNACGTAWQSAGTATTLAPSGLANGLYYWQVRAQNTTGTTLADGGTWWAFRVGPAPPTFTKLTPANGASGLGSSVTLSWSALPDAGYWVCWDTTNNNSCDSSWLPNGGGAARALSGLAAGTYYWQARAQTASGVFDADDGAWWSFAVGGTTPPAAFGKASPANGASGLSSSPTLTWGASPGATGYQYCFDTTNDGACSSSWVSTGTTTSSALSSLAAGTYYWQVRAQNTAGTTDADGGAWWSFTVASASPPGAFGKTAPANGASGLASSLTFTWGASTGATGYQVCYDTTNDSACSASWVSVGTATSSAISGLSNGTYYWQVRAQNASGTTDANGGAWWSFTVGATGPTFTKLTPANGVSGLGSAVTLTWSPVADAGYWVCWDTTNNGACDGTWWPNGGGSARALSGLVNGTYYWQVRAQTAAGSFDGDGGTWFAFTVGGPPQPPGAFGKTAPASGASGLAGSLTLTWGASTAATSYEVCVDTTNDAACAGTWQSAGASASFGLSGLSAGTYYWQVRAVNSTGTAMADGGAWWSFSVSATPPLFGKLAPANGAINLGSSLLLQWSPVADAGYWVCWDTTNNGACDGAWWPNGGGAARELSGLAPGTYYWQVLAQRSSGTVGADNGTWFTFTVR